MTEIIPQNFITLAVSMKSLNEAEIRAKYPEEIANKMLNTNYTISEMVQHSNSNFAIRIDHHHFITKDKSKATSFVHIDKNADAGIKIVKELKDPNDTHKFTAKNCIKEINKRLRKLNISIAENSDFNMFHFNLFTKYFGIKGNTKYCYIHKISSSPTYSYSIHTIDFIVDEIKKNPHNIIEDLKKKVKKIS